MITFREMLVPKIVNKPAHLIVGQPAGSPVQTAPVQIIDFHFLRGAPRFLVRPILGLSEGWVDVTQLLFDDQA